MHKLVLRNGYHFFRVSTQLCTVRNNSFRVILKFFQFQPPLRFSPRLMPPAVEVLAPAGVVAGTKSTALLPPPAFPASLSFSIFSRLFLKRSLKAESGKPLGSHRSVGRVVSYWLRSSMSTNPISLSMSPGFRSDVEFSSLALKWTPFFLSSRNCSNFLLVPGGGDPGGEGGMSKLGTEGRVRSCIMARLTVYGDPGIWLVSMAVAVAASESSVDGRDGPKGTARCATGPTTGFSSCGCAPCGAFCFSWDT